MVRFFFYNKFKNIELIKKISNNFDISDGYIIVKSYDDEKSILEIGDKSLNNKSLYGKIVNFNMKLDDVITKINEIEECKIENKTKYIVETIWTNNTLGGTYEAYIIY